MIYTHQSKDCVYKIHINITPKTTRLCSHFQKRNENFIDELLKHNTMQKAFSNTRPILFGLFRYINKLYYYYDNIEDDYKKDLIMQAVSF